MLILTRGEKIFGVAPIEAFTSGPPRIFLDVNIKDVEK